MKCCPKCFDDRGLTHSIFPLRSTEDGDCSYCGSSNVPVLSPQILAEYFELLVSAYHINDGGRLLVQWFREDWGLFTHPQMDDPRAKDLLAEILNNGEVVRKRVSPALQIATDRLGEWEQLRDELMYHNRYFPDANIDLNRLRELLDHLKIGTDEVPRRWFRARIREGENPFSIDKMGAPPKGTASHGRANPAGIPYLYIGSTPETAIAEIRPHAGEIACVADFNTPADLLTVS